MDGVVYETAIKDTGWGLYHRGVIAVSCLCCMVDGEAVVNVAFTLPLASCGFRTFSAGVLLLHAVTRAGTAVGSFLFGFLSDVVGRRVVVTAALIFQFIGLIMSSFSPTESMFLLSLFVLGLGISSSTTAAKVYIAEILPQNKRASRLVLLEAFWSLGYLINLGLFSAMVPLVLRCIEDTQSRMKFYTWRTLFAAVGTAAILVSCCTGLLGSSPRFLLATRRTQDAEEVLRQIYAVNLNQHAESCQLPSELGSSVAESPLRGRLSLHVVGRTLINLCAKLLRRPLVFRTLFAALASLCFVAGESVLNVWLARLLVVSEEHSMQSCELGSRSFLMLDYSVTNMTSNCTLLRPYPAHYALPLASSMLLGRIVLLFIADHVRRTVALVVLLASAGSSCALLPFFDLHGLRVCLALLLMGCYAAASSLFSIICIEAFPTCVRGTANGLVPVVSRLALAVSVRVLWAPCTPMLWTLAASMFGAALLCCLLPDRSQKPMME